MSITDELREYGHDCCARVDDAIHAIADRIDAEHERVRAESIIDMTDESMAEHGWIRLPKDADGKVWDVGDELLDDGMVCEVVGIGPNRLYYYCDATDTVEWTQADSRRHYHAPTVEDVLREFAEGLGVPVANSYLAATAAKLRLAEEDA